MGNGLLLAANRLLLTSTTRPSVRTAALERLAIIRHMEPIFGRLDRRSGPAAWETVSPAVLHTAFLPASLAVTGGQLQLSVDGAPSGAPMPIGIVRGSGASFLAEGFRLAKRSTVSAVATFATADGPLTSAPRLVPIGGAQLVLDVNNDTRVDDDDEAIREQRPDAAFAFWEGGENPEWEDLATLRLALTVPATTLRVSLVGQLPVRWRLRRKVDPNQEELQGVNPQTHPANKGYLWSTAAALRQRTALREISPTNIADDVENAAVELTDVPAGTHDYVFYCERCPKDADRKLRLEYVEGTRRWPVDTATVEIQPISDWVSVLTARAEDGHTFESTTYSPILNGVSSAYRVGPKLRCRSTWAEMPSNVSPPEGCRVTSPISPPDPETRPIVNVLVHGFAVSEAEATTARGAAFPTWFKRLYWVGHPVFRPQGAHTVGITWPKDIPGITVPGAGPVRPYYPEDEFSALQSGVPISRWLAPLRSTLGPHGRISIFAHSLGNLAVNSALRLDPGDPSGARVTLTQWAARMVLFPGQLENEMPRGVESGPLLFRVVSSGGSPQVLVEPTQ